MAVAAVGGGQGWPASVDAELALGRCCFDHRDLL